MNSPPQGWLFSFSGGKRFSPMQKIRCAVVLKAHGPLLRFHPLQLVAMVPSSQGRMPKERGHRQRAKDMEGHA